MSDIPSFPNNPNPYWTPDAQNWAIDQQRMSHTQALYMLGEYAVFVLMWQISDFEEGLVERCPLCFKAFDKIAETYGQAARQKCENCYGTTFEGGYKAILVRPSLWDMSEEDITQTRTGQNVVRSATVQSTEDFQLNSGDYAFRYDGSRWEMNAPADRGAYLRTGFQSANADQQAVGFNYSTASRVDESDVAYLIPPDPTAVQEILGAPNIHTPIDFTPYEEIRGPLR